MASPPPAGTGSQCSAFVFDFAIVPALQPGIKFFFAEDQRLMSSLELPEALAMLCPEESQNGHHYGEQQQCSKSKLKPAHDAILATTGELCIAKNMPA
jgi:hypothetical protein